MRHIQESSNCPLRLSFALGDVVSSSERATERRLDEEALARMDDESGSSSSNPPNPEPSTKPILGRTGVCDSRNCAAAPALVNSSVIPRNSGYYLLAGLPEHTPAAPASFAASWLQRAREQLAPAFRFPLRLLRRRPCRYHFHIRPHQRHQLAHGTNFFQVPDRLLQLLLRAV